MHKWKEVVEYFVKKGDTHWLWGYITALRGPDYTGTTYLKALMTCVLRGEVADSAGAHGVDLTTVFLDGSDINELKNKIGQEIALKAGTHALRHIALGFQALVEYYNNSGEYHEMLVKLVSKMERAIYKIVTEYDMSMLFVYLETLVRFMVASGYTLKVRDGDKYVVPKKEVQD